MASDMAPKVTTTPGAYIISWPLEHDLVRFSAKRIKTHSDGRLTGIVSVAAGSNSHEEKLMHSAMNLSSSQARRGIIKTLDERYDLEGDIPWDQIIETSCRLIMEREEQGEPIRKLERIANVEVEYLLPPLLLAHLPTVIYAPGGQGKSLVAMYLALLLQNGLDLDLEPAEQVNVLYLDYESDEAEANRRATLLASGIERTSPVKTLDLPLYRRCALPLRDEVAELAAIVAEHNIGLIIIDSLGVAAGGDLNAAEVILGYFAALRKITESTAAASLSLGHTSKEDRRNPNLPRLPIGSVYTENCARLMFELRRDEESDRELDISLLPRKANIGKPEPVGLRYKFGNEAILTWRIAPTEVLTEGQTTQEAILDALGEAEASIEQLARLTGAPASTVRWNLMRLKQAGKVVPVSRGTYRLA